MARRSLHRRRWHGSGAAAAAAVLGVALLAAPGGATDFRLQYAPPPQVQTVPVDRYAKFRDQIGGMTPEEKADLRQKLKDRLAQAKDNQQFEEVARYADMLQILGN